MSSTKPRLSAEDWITGGLDLLADEGLAGIKVDALAERLGVTKGSFYWHFKNLPAFLEAMTEQFIAGQNAQIEILIANAPSEPRERLLTMMNYISEPHTSDLEREVRDWAHDNPPLAAHISEVDHSVHAAVRAAFEQLGFAGHDAEVRAKALYYAGIGRLHTGILGEPEGLEHREQLLDILMR